MNTIRKKRSVLPAILLLGLAFPGQGQAHGVHGDTESGNKTLCSSASYDDGGPMSYAGVKIIAPDTKLPFQTGRTDRNGCFCFRPDKPGTWKITIEDEDHYVRLTSEVGKEMLNKE